MKGKYAELNHNFELNEPEKKIKNWKEQITRTPNQEKYNKEKQEIECKYDNRKKERCIQSKNSQTELLKNYHLSMRKETSKIIQDLKQIDTDFNPLNFSKIQEGRTNIYQKLISPSFKHLLKHSERNLKEDIQNYLDSWIWKVFDYDEEILDSLIKAKEQQSKLLRQYDKKLSPELNNTIYNYIDENIIKYKEESQIQESEKQARILGAKDKLKIFDTLKEDYLNTVYAKNIDIDNTNPDFWIVGNLHDLLERLENWLNKIQKPESLEKDDFKDTFIWIWDTLWDVIHILRNFSYESLNTVLEICKNSVHKSLYDIDSNKAWNVEKWIQDLPGNPYFDMRLTYQVVNATTTWILDSWIFLAQIYLKANLKPWAFVWEIKNEWSLLIKDFFSWVSWDNIKKLSKQIQHKITNEPEESMTNMSYIAWAVTWWIMLPKHMNMKEWPSLWKTWIHLWAKWLGEWWKIAIVSYYLTRQKTLEWKIKNLEKKFGFSDEARQYHYKEFESLKKQFKRWKKDTKESKTYNKIKREYEKNLPNRNVWEINKNEIVQERKRVQKNISKYTGEKEYVQNKVSAFEKQKKSLNTEIEDFIKEQIFDTLKREWVFEKNFGLPNKAISFKKSLNEGKKVVLNTRWNADLIFAQNYINNTLDSTYKSIFSTLKKELLSSKKGFDIKKSKIHKDIDSIDTISSISQQEKKSIFDSIINNKMITQWIRKIQEIEVWNKRRINKLEGLKWKIQTNRRKDTLLNKQESYLKSKLNKLQNKKKELGRIEKKIEKFYHRLQRYAKRAEEFKKYDSRERKIINKENIEFQKILWISDSNPKWTMSVKSLEKYFDSYQKSNQYLLLQKRAENFYTSQKWDHIKELQNYKTLYDENNKLLSQAKNILGTEVVTKAEQALQSSREIFGEKIFQLEAIGKSVESGRQRTENIVASVEKSVTDIMKHQYLSQEVISEVKKKVNDIIQKQKPSLNEWIKINLDIEKQIQWLEKLWIPESFSRDILESELLTSLGGKKLDLLKRYELFNKKWIDYNKMILKWVDKIEKNTSNRLTKEEALIIFTYSDYFLYEKLNRFMRWDRKLLKTMTEENIKATKNVILKLDLALKKMPNLKPWKDWLIFRWDKLKWWQWNIWDEIQLKSFTSVENNKENIFLWELYENNILINIKWIKPWSVKDISDLALFVHFAEKLNKKTTINEWIIIPNSEIKIIWEVKKTQKLLWNKAWWNSLQDIYEVTVEQIK